MRKSVIIIIGIILCLGVLVTIHANAQSINQSKMDQDLKVASNVLKSMLEGDRGRVFYGSRAVEATYMEGYGVIFSMPRNNIWRIANTVNGNRVVIGSNGRDKKVAEEKAEARDAREAVAAVAPRVTSFSNIEASDEEYLEKVKSFLVDYSLLIGQLKPTDRVSVKQKNQHNELFYTYNISSGTADIDESKSGNISVESKVSDLKAMREGKISREEALKRVKVFEEEEVEVEEDVRLFGNIIRTVYESNVSSTYYMSERPRVERITDFGAIYSLKFYSSSPMGFGEDRLHHIPTLNLRDVPQADRDKKIAELYPKFIRELKENLVEYGRTVRSLKDSENIVVKAKLTTCAGCGIPESVELTLSVKDLKLYGSGSMTKDSAVSNVELKEIGKQ